MIRLIYSINMHTFVYQFERSLIDHYERNHFDVRRSDCTYTIFMDPWWLVCPCSFLNNKAKQKVYPESCGVKEFRESDKFLGLPFFPQASLFKLRGIFVIYPFHHSLTHSSLTKGRFPQDGKLFYSLCAQAIGSRITSSSPYFKIIILFYHSIRGKYQLEIEILII